MKWGKWVVGTQVPGDENFQAEHRSEMSGASSQSWTLGADTSANDALVHQHRLWEGKSHSGVLRPVAALGVWKPTKCIK